MTINCTWPQSRYPLAWMTQRLANRAPESTYLRQCPFSTGQQILNTAGLEIQRKEQILTEEKYNMFLSSANIFQLDHLYQIRLSSDMSFSYSENRNGERTYNVPTVYGTLNDTEYELMIAQYNDIESLYYKAIPSRLEYGEEHYSYESIISTTTFADLEEAEIKDSILSGHLYITVSNNNTWEYRYRNTIYYSKIHITGKTRKGTIVTEVVPLRYNGTFKTINQWESITKVFATYMDDEASISLGCLPFDQSSIYDPSNIVIWPDKNESWRFLKLYDRSWGSTLVSEAFIIGNLDILHKDEEIKETQYEIELLDSDSNNISASAMAIKPYSNLAIVADQSNMYIYNFELPYPNTSSLEGESTDTKMDLFSDRWIYTRSETGEIKTQILDSASVPIRYRWTLTEPDGQEYRLDSSGNKSSTSVSGWISNDLWEYAQWKEQAVPINIEDNGVYTISFEATYMTNENLSYSLITKYLFYCPYITPENTFSLPTELLNITNLSFDSDGNLWALVNDEIKLINLFYDYFLVDYEKDIVWLRENYSSVRVVI